MNQQIKQLLLAQTHLRAVERKLEQAKTVLRIAKAAPYAWHHTLTAIAVTEAAILQIGAQCIEIDRAEALEVQTKIIAAKWGNPPSIEHIQCEDVTTPAGS